MSAGLDAFARDLSQEATVSEITGDAIAARLFDVLNAGREEHGIADLWRFGAGVEMKLENGEFWAVECIGPAAFRMYPAVVRGNSVTWMNMWVADDYPLRKLMRVLIETLAEARRGARKDQ